MTHSDLDRMDAAQRRRRLLALGAGIIVVLTLLAYSRVLTCGFIWDDESYVTDNVLLHDIDGLVRIWKPGETPQYYPIVFTTFWLEYHVWQLDPKGYHVVNVVLHLLNALLLWAICRKIGLPAAASWLIGAVFALHPVHVESVAWITERKNVLSGFFYLSAAWTYLHFAAIHDREIERKPPNEAWGWYGVSLLLFALALLSKSVTCSLPAALILVMLWRRTPMIRTALLTLAPMFVLGLIAALNTASIERTVVGAQGLEFALPFTEQLQVACRALLFYPGKLFWPQPLMFNYPRWDVAATATASWAIVGFVFLIGAVLVVLYARGRRGPFLALAFFAGTVFPALGFINVYPHQFSFVADHFQYLASIGVIVLAVMILDRWLGDPRRLLAVAGVPLLVYAVLTWVQIGDYRTLETLWTSTLQKNPDAWMPHNNLSSIRLRQAAALLQQDENAAALIEVARIHAQTAVDLKPGHHTAHSNLSEALRLQGRYDEAVQHIDRAVAEKPAWPEHHRNQGRLRELIGDPDGAIVSYRQTLARRDDHVPARLDLARLLVTQQRLGEAAAAYEIILRYQPDSFTALGTLANLLTQLDRPADADALYDHALRVAPRRQDQIQIAMRHAVFLLQCPEPTVRNPDKAVFIAEQVVGGTNRTLPNTLDVLAMAYAAAGRFENAVSTGEEAIALARRLGLADMVTEYEARLEAYRRGALPPLAQPQSD